MYTIKIRRKRFLLFISGLFLCIYLLSLLLASEWLTAMIGMIAPGECNVLLRWAPKSAPVIAIVGAEGSGTYWARFLIEQMTGIYTGSINIREHPDVFKAEGVTQKVVTVLVKDIKDVKDVHGVIVVYRNMKDTVRTQFAMEKGKGAFLEAPMAAYYGKAWQLFADKQTREWQAKYKSVLESGLPILVVGHEELYDTHQLRTHLLKISNFLHVPIRSSVLDCVLEKSQDFPIKPTSLRQGFQPFSLLPLAVRQRYDRIENDIQMRIRIKRDRFMPKVR